MSETLKCDKAGVCIKGLLFTARFEALGGLRATRLEYGLHTGGDPDVLDELQAEARAFHRVQRTCLRSALSGPKCPGGGACGKVFTI